MSALFNPQWTCRDGRKIAVRDMETTHIENSKRMVERAQKRTMKRGLKRAFSMLDLAPSGCEEAFSSAAEEIVSAMGLAERWIRIFDEELARRKGSGLTSRFPPNAIEESADWRDINWGDQ